MTADVSLRLARQSPLGATDTGPFPVTRAEGIEIVERPFLAMADLRMPPADAAITGMDAALGLRLPTTPNRLVRAPGAFRLAIWLGPDQWLVVEDGVPADLEARLSAAAAPFGGSVVDVSAHRTLLELRGPRVPDVLSAGCSLDLHPRRFDIGSAAQAMLARVDVILGRGDADVYHVAVRTSFARYLGDWLIDAMSSIEGERT